MTVMVVYPDGPPKLREDLRKHVDVQPRRRFLLPEQPGEAMARSNSGLLAAAVVAVAAAVTTVTLCRSAKPKLTEDLRWRRAIHG